MRLGAHGLSILSPPPDPPNRCPTCGRFWKVFKHTRRRLEAEHDCPLRMRMPKDLLAPSRYLYPVFTPLGNKIQRP